MSRYMDRFDDVASGHKDDYELIGDALLVEKIEQGEQKIGSIYIAPSQSARSTFDQDQPTFVRILAIGEGYYDEKTKESISLNVRPGDIALVSNLSVRWFSTFLNMGDYELNTIGITRESEIKMRFNGEAGYNNVKETLRKHAEKALEAKKKENL